MSDLLFGPGRSLAMLLVNVGKGPHMSDDVNQATTLATDVSRTSRRPNASVPTNPREAGMT